MRRALLSTTILLLASLASAAWWNQEVDVGERFAELAAQGDRAATIELWKAHPEETLSAIDAYLEGSLAQVEAATAKKQAVDPSAIASMHATAIFGASAADEAFGTAIFEDYAASFAGFDAEQQRAFRRGQAAHSEARKALKAGQGAQALAKAKECAELARPLGDWWGTAMGLAAMGAAHEKLGQASEALEAHSQAALIYHDLRLEQAAYPSRVAMARLSVELGRKPRAKAAIERALAQAKAYADAAGLKELEGLAKKVE